MERFTRSAIIILILFASVSTYAADQPDGFFVRAGISIPTGEWNTGYLIESDLQLGEIMPGIYLQPFASFRGNSVSRSDRELSLNHFAVGTKIIHYFGMRARGPYLGASIAYNLINSDQLYTAPKVEVISRDDQRVSLSMVAGFSGRIWRMEPVVETKYVMMPGGYNTLLISAGVYIDL